MAHRITNQDVYAVAKSIARDSDVIRAIECHAGSSSYNRSWMFTFHLHNGTEFQHSFWNLALNTAREAHTFLRGMAHMLELQNRANDLDNAPVETPTCPECGIEFPEDSIWCEDCGTRSPDADAMMRV